MNGDEQDGLAFEMDDISMADLIGESDDKDATTKAMTEAMLPTCPMDVNQELSMDELMDATEAPHVQPEKPEEAENDGLPMGILDDALPVGMSDLLSGADEIENLEGVISDIRLEDALVDLENGDDGRLMKSEFGRWSEVAVGDRVRVGRK